MPCLLTEEKATPLQDPKQIQSIVCLIDNIPRKAACEYGQFMNRPLLQNTKGEVDEKSGAE